MKTRHWLKIMVRTSVFLAVLFCASSAYAFNLGVRVIDCTGKGMGNVRVKVFRVYGDGSTKLDRDLRTEASGNLDMQGFEQGTYEIVVFCPKGTAIRHEFYPGPFVGGAGYVFRCCPSGSSGIVSGTFYYDSGQVETTIYDEAGNKVKVSMTNDQAAGGTFSGTVVAEATGKTPEERDRNTGELNGRVISVANAHGSVGQRALTWSIPAVLSKAALDIVIRDRNGKVIGSAEVPCQTTPIKPRPPAQPGQATFKLPTIGQVGRSLRIEGPFDGKLDTTSITIGGQEVEKIAESPNQVIFKPRDIVSGRTEIVVRKDNLEVKSEYRNVTVNLSAASTTINTGQTVNVKAEFTGLGGITEDVPVIIEVVGPVALPGGNFQTRKISPHQVKDGKYEMTLPLTGQRPGAFNVTATIVTKGHERVVSGPNVFYKGPDGNAGMTDDECKEDAAEVKRLEKEIADKEDKKNGIFAKLLDEYYLKLGGVISRNDSPEQARDKCQKEVEKLKKANADPAKIAALEAICKKFSDAVDEIAALKKQLEEAKDKLAKWKAEEEKKKAEEEAKKKEGSKTGPQSGAAGGPGTGTGKTVKKECDPERATKKVTRTEVGCVISNAVLTKLGYTPEESTILNIATWIVKLAGGGQGVTLGKSFAAAFSSNAARHIYVKVKRTTTTYTDVYVCENGKWVLKGQEGTPVVTTAESGWIKLLNKDGGVDYWIAGDTEEEVNAAAEVAKQSFRCP